MSRVEPILRIRFYRTANGREPVRDWLRALPPSERKAIGDDLRTVQFGWPLGMPVVRALEHGIWEVRTNLATRTARVLFSMHRGEAILLHGFMKTTTRTPPEVLRLARRRAGELA
jgi:phage-related protein